MGDLVLGVFRSSSPAPASPPNIGDKWLFEGDSHNFGYGDRDGTGAVVYDPTCKTPAHAFCRIWQTLGLSGPTNPYSNFSTVNESAAVYQNGFSGRSLLGTLGEYNATTGRTDRTFVHFQESGSQENDGQRTASEFGDTWDDFVDAIFANTPNAIILTETAFNFRRGPPYNSDPGRDWTDYNVELRARIAARSLPNQIFLCETDRDIKLLETAIGHENVWFHSGESNPYHYKAVGNLMIALGYFKALRYDDIVLADLADIGTSVVSADWQQECLDIYNAN
jgi:hypothetical protein